MSAPHGRSISRADSGISQDEDERPRSKGSQRTRRSRAKAAGKSTNKISETDDQELPKLPRSIAIDEPRPSSARPDVTRAGRRDSFSSSHPSSSSTRALVKRCRGDRPSAPRRINSAPTSAHGPRHGHIDDILALHQQSCRLFRQPTFMSEGHASPPQPTLAEENGSIAPSVRPPLTAYTSFPSLEVTAAPPVEPHPPLPRTVTLWTSIDKKRKEYAKIDKRSKGFWGLWRTITPKGCFGSTKKAFYDETGSDAGSVRRYRLSLPNDEEKAAAATAHDQDLAVRLSRAITGLDWGTKKGDT